MSFLPVLSTETLELALREQECQQQQSGMGSSALWTTANGLSPSAVVQQNRASKKERWRPRDKRFEKLMNEARKWAELRHTAFEREKIGKPSRRPSRAISSKQKSSKKSAEICRIKMQVYAEILEAKLARTEAENEKLRRAQAEEAQAERELRAKYALLLQEKQNQAETIIPKRKMKTASSASCLSNVTMDKENYFVNEDLGKDELFFSQIWNALPAHMMEDVGDVAPPLPIDRAWLKTSESTPNMLPSPPSSLSLWDKTEVEDDIITHQQIQEVETYNAAYGEVGPSDAMYDFDEMSAHLDCASAAPAFTSTAFSPSPFGWSFSS